MDKDGVATMLIGSQTSSDEVLSSKVRCLHLATHEVAERFGISEDAARGLVTAAQRSSLISIRVSR